MGSLLAARLGEITGISYEVLPVGNGPEFYIGREHHFNGRSPEHREWILENYPELQAGSRIAVLQEVAAAQATLQPKIRERTPAHIFDAVQALIGQKTWRTARRQVEWKVQEPDQRRVVKQELPEPAH